MSTLRATRDYRTLIPYAVLVIATTVLLVALKVPVSRLDVPFSFEGDSIDKLTQITNVGETGWLFHNDRLGFPFGYDRLDFPRFDSLNYVLIAPLVWLAGPVAAMNLYFIAGFYLIAFAAYACLRRLGLDTAPALLCALAYAFLPYHVLRGVSHLTNGAYFLVPFAMLAATWLALDRLGADSPDARRRWILALVVAALVPLQMPYNGVFFAYLAVVACAVSVARSARLRSVVIALSLLAATASAFVLEQLPVIVHSLEAGKPALVADRMPLEAELYAMRLNQLLMPTEADRRPTFKRAAKDFDQTMAVPFSEVRNQYIGALGILGFLALFWALCRAVAARATRDASADVDIETVVRVTALLALAILLLAIASGFGTLVSYWITSKIRAYNRVLPFFAFACFVGAGWALQTATRQIGRPWLRHATLALIAVVALYDVLVRPFPGPEKVAIEYDGARSFFAAVERRLGDGAAVFQLPALWYPEHPPVNAMGDYEEFKPFLLTRTLRFSYGVGRGRSGYSWNKYVEGLPPRDAVAKIHAMGFAAVLVDALAYDADALRSLTDAYAAASPEPPSVSPDRRWWLFPLAGCCGDAKTAVESGAGPRLFSYTVGSAPIRFDAGGDGVLYGAGGWHDPESWGTWSAGVHAGLRLRLDPVPSSALSLTLDTRMLIGPNVPKRTLSITANGHHVGDFAYDMQSSSQPVHVQLAQGTVGADGLLELGFDTTPQASPYSAGLSVDARELGVGLVELSIVPAGATRDR